MLVKLDVYMEGQNCSGLLHKLVQNMAVDSNPGLQVTAAIAVLISSLASNDTLQRMAMSPHFVNNLEGLLWDGRHPKQQKWAKEALADLFARMTNLAFDEQLHKLLRFVADDAKPDLQVIVASVFRSLAHKGMSVELTTFPHLLDDIIALLAAEYNPALQIEAAGALNAMLRSGGADVARIIGHHPNFLEKLIPCITDDCNSSLQGEATSALRALTRQCTQDETLMDESAFARNLLGGLGECLAKSSDGILINHDVGETICDLGRVADSLKLQLLRSSSFPGSLSRALAHGSVTVQGCAADVILSWSRTKDTAILNEFVNFPRLLERLEKSLENEGEKVLQNSSASALANLAGAENRNLWLQVVNLPLLVRVSQESLF